MNAMRRRVVVTVFAVLVALGALGAYVLSRDGTRVEQLEHLIRGDENTVREPHGEWIASVPGREAVLWAVGDADSGPEAAALAGAVERGRPDRVLYLGDVYPIGTADSFDEWSRTWGRLAPITAPTPGNHDWSEAAEGYDPYWRDVTGRTPPTFYAFEAGGWEIVSINSEAPHETGSKQERWLRNQMAARSGSCRVVFWHRPRFSAGPRGDAATTEPLWRHLPGHARFLLSGHEHNLQRLQAQRGVVPFVIGAAGRGHQDVTRTDPRLEFADTRNPGALRLRLSPGRADWAVIAADGRRLDEGRAACTPLGPARIP